MTFIRPAKIRTVETADADLVLRSKDLLQETSTGRLFVGDDVSTIAELRTADAFYAKVSEAGEAASGPLYLYEAALTQSGTDAPSAVVFPHTSSAITVTWTRTGAGTYDGTFSANIIPATSGVLLGAPGWDGGLDGSVYFVFHRLQADKVTVYAAYGFGEDIAAQDGILQMTMIRMILTPAA
jgi:hypothetical protein